MGKFLGKWYSIKKPECAIELSTISLIQRLFIYILVNNNLELIWYIGVRSAFFQDHVVWSLFLSLNFSCWGLRITLVCSCVAAYLVLTRIFIKNHQKRKKHHTIWSETWDNFEVWEIHIFSLLNVSPFLTISLSHPSLFEFLEISILFQNWVLHYVSNNFCKCLCGVSCLMVVII